MDFKLIAETLNKKSVDKIKQLMDSATNGYQIYNPFVDPIVPEVGGTTDSKLKLFQFKEEDFKGKSVSDLGCNLGAFSFLALNNGASNVISYEMDKNFKGFLDLIIHNYYSIFPYYYGRLETVQLNLNTLPKIRKTDILLVIAIIHWFFVFNPNITMAQIAKWLNDNCNESIYFEGCVTAAEPVMKQYKVEIHRFNEKLFLDEMSKYFTFKTLGRPAYNPNRLVAKFTKK